MPCKYSMMNSLGTHLPGSTVEKRSTPHVAPLFPATGEQGCVAAIPGGLCVGPGWFVFVVRLVTWTPCTGCRRIGCFVTTVSNVCNPPPGGSPPPGVSPLPGGGALPGVRLRLVHVDAVPTVASRICFATNASEKTTRVNKRQPTATRKGYVREKVPTNVVKISRVKKCRQPTGKPPYQHGGVDEALLKQELLDGGLVVAAQVAMKGTF